MISYQNLQSVRWRRKPIWMPTAKSKLYRIPVKPVIPEEEKEEIKRLYNNYRTYIKSIRRFLTYKHSVLLMAKSDTEQLKKAFDEDFMRCKEINDKWNEDLKKLREERVAKQLQEEIEFAKNRMANLIKQKEQKLAEAEEIVRKEKQMVGTFITPENLDEVIEKALSNPVDYNFAIDLEGNRIIGRETKPEEQVSVKQ
ncbi:MRP-S26 domain containing protein [Asbolus verrucosus]|uniref:Small ribosomal subunit protein mS26 n=1 Tax=Asbolus verrucosus TaxID=1661398 RepID=A0A482VMJ2_ASBVE|nr:MRP-S26 domain containing protein [Asbolus verrucosus]